MASQVYKINKGVNQSVEFRGLKAQYIWYLGIGFVVLIILFSVLYFLQIPSLICVMIIGLLELLFFMRIYRMSQQYGEFGLMKALAKKQLPKHVISRERGLFRFEKSGLNR
jgi:xanthosine utilization system XapX-like protein